MTPTDNPVGDALMRQLGIDPEGGTWWTNEEEIVLDDGMTRIVIPPGCWMRSNLGALDLGVVE